MQTENQFIDKLAWIYIKDRKILSTRSKNNDTYYIPGGKRIGGESDQEALMREIKEELSIELVAETIEYVGTFEAQAHGKPKGTIVRMTCYKSDFTGEIKADNEIEEIIWLTHGSEVKKSPVDLIILNWLKKKDFID
jgi:8-oxo-dGTP diphosphatase